MAAGENGRGAPGLDSAAGVIKAGRNGRIHAGFPVRPRRACQGLRTIRCGGNPNNPTAVMPLLRLGPPAWSFAVDAHSCIMVPPHQGLPNTRLRAVSAPESELLLRSSSRPHRLACSAPTRPSPAGARRMVTGLGSSRALLLRLIGTRTPTVKPKKNR